MNIKIGNLELGTVPRVVGIVDRMMPAAQIKDFAERGVDIFELRADLINEPVDAVIEYAGALRESVPSPLIGTVRETDSNRSDRVAWYKSLAEYVDCVDIELGMPEWCEVAGSIPKSTLIMVSEHDFSGTPDIAGLDDIVRRSLSQGAAVVKIAVTAACAGDVTRLLRFTEDCKTPLVTMAMGEIGALSRIIAPLFGSLFSYGYLREPIVPGQLPALKIISALNDYFPPRRACPASSSGERR